MSLLETVQKIAQFKIQPDKVHIEEPVFRIFSKVSVGCLLLCATLVTMQTLIGEHIKCVLPPKEDVRPEALNQYCFIMSTYTVPNLYGREIGVEIPHFGVGPHNPEDGGEKYHYYYQWVPFALFFQGISFLIPHYLWKIFEEKRVRTYCELQLAPHLQMKTRGLIGKDQSELDEKESAINKAAVCFVGNLSYNKSYAILYIICEVLNLFMVLLNFYFTNVFLGSNAFKNYGPRVVAHLRDDPDSELNPMNQLFPKVSKCDFHKYGPGGNLIRYDILCVLALNIINEKIYVFLWFWFVILGIIGILAIVYRCVMVFVPRMRFALLQRRVARKYTDALKRVLEMTGYADWFLLKLLSDNIDSIRFGELCDQIQDVLKQRSPNGRISHTPSSTPSFHKSHEDDIDKPFLNKP